MVRRCSSSSRSSVMEYVEGESLFARVARGQLSIDEVRAIGRQLASALSAAHGRGVVHRDLKPANIQITPDGLIKVLDFGVAKLSPAIVRPPQRPKPWSRMARYRGIPGTPTYMSPEQLFGLQIDARSDVYSAGVVLFEAATGRRPYPETGAVALALAMSSSAAPEAVSIRPDVPTDLNAAIAGALQRDVEKRFQSARELEAALDGSAAAQAALSRPGRAAILLAAVLAAAVIGAIGVTFKPALSKLTETHAVRDPAGRQPNWWSTSAPDIWARASRRR